MNKTVDTNDNDRTYIKTTHPSFSNEASQGGKNKPSKKKKFIFLSLLIIILLFIIFHFLSFFHNAHQTKKHLEQPQAVSAQAAHIGDMPVILQLLGTVVPITNVTITPRVSGHILTVYYQEGQHVHKGDLLELIDPRPYEATLAQYQGTLESDRAQLAKARIDNARYQKLISQNSISAMTAKDQSYTVQQLEGQVKFDEANVHNAELNVMYCHIIAPVDGRVGIRALDAGNYVTIGQSGGLTTLTQMQPISVIFTLAQNNLFEVQEALKKEGALTVEAWDSDNNEKLATGSVKALDSQLDTATGTVKLRGIFTNEDERLFPNEFVNAHLLVKNLHNVILIPTAALQTGPDGSFVYIIKKDMHVAIATVTPGESDDQNTVILSGLKKGEMVVTDGTNHLRPNSKIYLASNENSIPKTHHAHSKSSSPTPSPQ